MEEEEEEEEEEEAGLDGRALDVIVGLRWGAMLAVVLARDRRLSVCLSSSQRPDRNRGQITVTYKAVELVQKRLKYFSKEEKDLQLSPTDGLPTGLDVDQGARRRRIRGATSCRLQRSVRHDDDIAAQPDRQTLRVRRWRSVAGAALRHTRS